jgi:hypothetical protein
MRKLIFLFLILPGLSLSGQTDSISSSSAYQLLIGDVYKDPGVFHNGIYFRNPYLPGKVYFTSGDSVSGIYLRYNSKDDELLWLNKGFGQIKLEKTNINGFVLQNQDTAFRFLRMNLSAHDGSDNFYQECLKGPVSLYASRRVTQYSSYYSKNIQFFKYRPQSKYIAVINGRKFYFDNPKLKSLYERFPGKKTEIAAYIRENDLKIANEETFIALIKQLEFILLK